MNAPPRGTARVFGRGALIGLASGVAGVAAMTLGEKLEQVLTGRPSSFVPAHTLERLLGLPTRPDEERVVLNCAGLTSRTRRVLLVSRPLGSPRPATAP